MSGIAPALPMLLAALALCFFGKGSLMRLVVVVAAPVLTFLAAMGLPDGVAFTVGFLDMTLEPVEKSTIATLFAVVFSLMALAGGIYALKCEHPWELPAAFLYMGGAFGAIFAGDWVTLLVFWEVMAIGSALVIMAGGQPNSNPAAMRYLYIHLLGGVIFMAGIVGHVLVTSSTDFTQVPLDGLPAWLILIGVLVNAAAWPIGAWAPDAYPEASPTGTIFLSAFTTKTAVFVLWVAFPGVDLLVWVGLIMAIYGAIYAAVENDVRRILIYALVNQVGFLVAAVGMGTSLSLNGAGAHAFAHILYKALLLMSAGAVIVATGKRRLDELGNLGRTMPFTAACAIIAMATGAALPGTGAYATKSLITSAAGLDGQSLTWLILTATGAAIYMTAMLRFVYFTFFGPHPGPKGADPALNMKIGMGLLVLACLIPGVMPELIYGLLPFGLGEYSAYKSYLIVYQIQLLGAATLAFFVLKPLLQPTRWRTLDTDWVYRRLLFTMGTTMREQGGARRQDAMDEAKEQLNGLMTRVEKHHGEDGLLARTWPAGSMALWASILLGVIIVVAYVSVGIYEATH